MSILLIIRFFLVFPWLDRKYGRTIWTVFSWISRFCSERHRLNSCGSREMRLFDPDLSLSCIPPAESPDWAAGYWWRQDGLMYRLRCICSRTRTAVYRQTDWRSQMSFFSPSVSLPAEGWTASRLSCPAGFTNLAEVKHEIAISWRMQSIIFKTSQITPPTF